MNYKEYKKDEDNHVKGIHYWANKCRQLQKSLKYNPGPNATVRHHLRDTEEQRKYNDEHYEMWGFEVDENGNEHFEYGKYIIFVTHDEHSKIHGICEETRKNLVKLIREDLFGLMKDGCNTLNIIKVIHMQKVDNNQTKLKRRLVRHIKVKFYQMSIEKN